MTLRELAFHRLVGLELVKFSTGDDTGLHIVNDQNFISLLSQRTWQVRSFFYVFSFSFSYQSKVFKTIIEQQIGNVFFI